MSTALRPHMQNEINATSCPTSIKGLVNRLLSGTTLKNARSLLAGIARFSGTSLLGILTFFQGFFNFTIPRSSSLNSRIAALYTSLIQTGYCSLLRVVVDKDSIHWLRKEDVRRENIMLSVPANLSMCCNAHL